LKRAKDGDTHAQNIVGILYDNGQGVSMDSQQAEYWYKQAVKGGSDSAVYNLGLLYENGTGTMRNPEQAVYWYKKRAENNDPKALYRLGKIYADTSSKLYDFKKAIYWYEKAAEHGDDYALFALGNIFSKRGTDQDFKKAVRYLEQASEKNIVPAKYNLAIKYQKGQGVGRNLIKAGQLYQEAAVADHEGARDFLMKSEDFCTKDIRKVKADEIEACLIALATGKAEIEYKVGNLYYSGDHIAQSYAIAANLYKRSAEKGHNGALMRLIQMPAGVALKQAPNEAFIWLYACAKSAPDEFISMSQIQHCKKLVPHAFRKLANKKDALHMAELYDKNRKN